MSELLVLWFGAPALSPELLRPTLTVPQLRCDPPCWENLPHFHPVSISLFTPCLKPPRSFCFSWQGNSLLSILNVTMLSTSASWRGSACLAVDSGVVSFWAALSFSLTCLSPLKSSLRTQGLPSWNYLLQHPAQFLIQRRPWNIYPVNESTISF